MGLRVACADPTGAAAGVEARGVSLGVALAELGATADGSLGVGGAAADVVRALSVVETKLPTSTFGAWLALLAGAAVADGVEVGTGSGRLQPPGVPAMPPNKPATTTLKAMTTRLVPDQAVTRTRRSRCPERSTKTGAVLARRACGAAGEPRWVPFGVWSGTDPC